MTRAIDWLNRTVRRGLGRPVEGTPAAGWKRLLVLANSTRAGGHCIAGREVVGPGHPLGPWLRPVGRTGTDALRAGEWLYRSGRPVGVLDVADVYLTGPAAAPGQPENWRVGRRRPWAPARPAVTRPDLRSLEEHPADLWVEPGNRTDRVTAGRLAARPPGPSLAIVRPAGFRVVLSTESATGRPRPRRRCRFSYRGAPYDLGLTDPVLIARTAGECPGRLPAEVRLPGGDDLLVCVSLAGDYHGHHYKVVAAVFEGVT